jgi:hypothetical protein
MSYADETTKNNLPFISTSQQEITKAMIFFFSLRRKSESLFSTKVTHDDELLLSLPIIHFRSPSFLLANFECARIVMASTIVTMRKRGN